MHFFAQTQDKIHSDARAAKKTMNFKAYLDRVGRVKQNQLRMMRARGCTLTPAENACLSETPTDVSKRYLSEALAREVTLCAAMSSSYERRAHGVREKIYVVFLGVRIQPSGQVKSVSVEALRKAFVDVVHAEGGDLSRFVAMSSARDVVDAADAGWPLPASVGASAPASVLVDAKVSAIIISPTALSPQAAKEVAPAKDWLSVLEYRQLLVAVDKAEGSAEHTFLRGEDAERALHALKLSREHLPTILRDDAVAAYYGALHGDVVRVNAPEGVVKWFSVL